MATPRYLVFYSYRGGVGRTLALCNVAARMAEAGDRILVIDLDLEAPGASVVLGEGRAAERDGLLESFREFRETESLPAIAHHMHPVSVGSASLYLLPAGRLDAEYPRKVGELDWVGDFDAASGAGTRFFETLRETIDAIEPPFHYVFVDSRPGVSASGAIALDLFADEVVLVCGLNRQSLAGLRWARARVENGKRIVHCVISPAPPRTEGYEQERAALRAALKIDPVWDLPFEPDLLWRERLLLASSDRALPLALRFDELTEALRQPDDVQLLVTRALADLQTPGKGALAQATLERARRKDPDDVRVLRALAHVKFLSGDDEGACEFAEHATAVSKGRDPALLEIIDDLYQRHQDAPGHLQDRLAKLFATHVGQAPTAEQRRLLVWFSVSIREALAETNEPDAKVRGVLEQLKEKACGLAAPEPRWSEFAERLPIRFRNSEAREDLRTWQRRCVDAGLPELANVVRKIGDKLRLYRDVSGVVDQFWSTGYGFLMSDDGLRSIHFQRDDCTSFGQRAGEYIPKGEVALFDLQESGDPNHPWRAQRVRFPQIESAPPRLDGLERIYDENGVYLGVATYTPPGPSSGLSDPEEGLLLTAPASLKTGRRYAIERDGRRVIFLADRTAGGGAFVIRFQ